MNNLESVKKLLDSDAGLIIEDMSQPTNKKIVDNRLVLIRQKVELIENKNDAFYSELIKLIGNYIGKLYDKKVEDFPNIVFAENGEILSQN